MQYEELAVDSVGAIDFHKAHEVHEVLNRLDKPVLVHGGPGAHRAVVLVLLQIAVETTGEEVSAAQVMDLAARVGMSFHNNYGIKTFVEEYLLALKAGRDCGADGQRLVVGHERLLRL